MSATRDKTQKTAFVYSNLYQMYRKHREAELKPESGQAPVAPPAYNHGVLKTAEMTAGAPFARVTVQSIRPAEFIDKHIERPAIKAAVNNPALESLKQNLKQLNDLHARLKFMLQELEELSKE